MNAAVIPSSGLTIALSVLLPFSGLLVLATIVCVPVVIFKRRRKVDTIQDYASTAIELLTRGNPLQLPPQLPPRFPPHLPQQSPRHDPPLSEHDNTSVISENSSVEMIQDYASTTIELTRGNPLQLPPQPPLHPPPHLPRRQYTPQLSTHDNTASISENFSVNDGPSLTHEEDSPSLTHEEDLKHPRGSPRMSIDTGKPKSKSAAYLTSSHPTTKTDILSYPTIMTDTPSQPLHPTTSTDSSFDPANITDPSSRSLHSTTRTPQLHCEDHYEQLGNVYDRMGTYETVGHVYEKVGTYETIRPTSSAANLIPRTGAPTSEGSKFTHSDGSKIPQLHCEDHYEQLGNVYDSIGTYETVCNVYDKICTYETIGNVYDNSIAPKL